METALQQQSKLVDLARGLMVQGAEVADVKAGLAAADGVGGLVIADEAALVAVNDRGAAIAKALKALKRAEDDVLDIPKQMVAAVKAVSAPHRTILEAARTALDDAQRAWNRRVREAAEAAERDRQRVIAEQARKDREAQAERDRIARENAEREAAAALEGVEPVLVEVPEEEEVPPPPEAPPIVAPPALVRTSAGSSTAVKRLKCELENPAECDPYWLVLINTTTPIAAFKAVLARGDVAEPGFAEKPVTWRGVRFWYDDGISRSAR